MRTFSPTLITIAGLALVAVEFATGATELPGLLGEDTYAVVAFVLGLVGVIATFILRDQAIETQHARAELEELTTPETEDDPLQSNPDPADQADDQAGQASDHED